jgi:hypothetical protein
MLSAPQIYKALNPKTEKFPIAQAIVELNREAPIFIRIIVPKGQVNLPCIWSVTIKL